MSIELSMVAAQIALGMFQLALTAIEYRRVHGVKYANTARDVPSTKQDSKLLGRLSRAQNNLMETAPYFIALALIIHLMGLSTDVTQLAAMAFVALRLIYLPLYAFGVPDIRGMVWTLSFIALGFMAYAVLVAVPWTSVKDPVMRLIGAF
jgi:uncharacterized MAPEG superfamily protein